jgi:hypothetical protein
MKLQLEKFEYLVYTRQYEAALSDLLVLLQILDNNYGLYKSNVTANVLTAIQGHQELASQHINIRLLSAVSTLFSDPGFNISENGFQIAKTFHRWIATLFAASPFGNADHVIYSYNLNSFDSTPFQLNNANLLKFCLLYSPDSRIEIDYEMFWNAHKELAANLYLMILSPRFFSSPEAFIKRDNLLKWLPGRLEAIESLAQLPLSILHDVYLNSSYSDIEQKHAIKRSINTLMRREITSMGFRDTARLAEIPAEGKPVMLVVLEWFNAGHSVYRVLSRAIIAAKEEFYLIAMGQATMVDSIGMSIFDEYIEIEDPSNMRNFLEQVSNVARERKPQILYMPSVGMSVQTMFLSNLRVAPIQITTLGHSASTFSPYMDYFIIDEDFVGDDSCFSEQVIKLPNDAFPFTRSSNADENPPQAAMRKNPKLIHIAMVASIMKLNPVFMETCRQIAEKSPTPVHFHFFIGFAQGLVGQQVQKFVKYYLGDAATVFFQQNYKEYVQSLAKCDLYINPFPFGNMNSIVDLLSVGLVGVCKSGREPHEHIDHGLFERLGIPSWLITFTNDEYIEACLRLINDHEERLSIRARMDKASAINRLFEGRSELFGKEIKNLLIQKMKPKQKKKN